MTIVKVTISLETNQFLIENQAKTIRVLLPLDETTAMFAKRLKGKHEAYFEAVINEYGLPHLFKKVSDQGW